MASKESTASGGVGFCGLLTILFIGLKLTGYIEWSWWVVFAPLWGPVLIALGLLVIVGLLWVIAEIVLD